MSELSFVVCRRCNKSYTRWNQPFCRACWKKYYKKRYYIPTEEELLNFTNWKRPKNG
jgi:predicted amidophosphoribosyltransferase